MMSDRGRQKVQQLAFSKLYGRDEVPRWDVKRWRGCIFSPRSLLPTTGQREGGGFSCNNKRIISHPVMYVE